MNLSSTYFYLRYVKKKCIFESLFISRILLIPGPVCAESGYPFFLMSSCYLKKKQKMAFIFLYIEYFMHSYYNRISMYVDIIFNICTYCATCSSQVTKEQLRLCERNCDKTACCLNILHLNCIVFSCEIKSFVLYLRLYFG